MIQRGLTPLILLIVFLLEGTVVQWLIPESLETRLTLVPNLVLILIIYIGTQVGRHQALYFGLIFGLLKDIVFYGPVIGIYTFSTALVGYLSGLVFKLFHHSFFLSILTVALGDFAYELSVYGLYRLLHLTSVTFYTALYTQFIPTVILNFLLAILLYVPTTKWISSWIVDREEEER